MSISLWSGGGRLNGAWQASGARHCPIRTSGRPLYSLPTHRPQHLKPLRPPAWALSTRCARLPGAGHSPGTIERYHLVCPASQRAAHCNEAQYQEPAVDSEARPSEEQRINQSWLIQQQSRPLLLLVTSFVGPPPFRPREPGLAPEVTAQAGAGADPQPKTSLWLEGGSHAGLRVLYASVINQSQREACRQCNVQAESELNVDFSGVVEEGVVGLLCACITQNSPEARQLGTQGASSCLYSKSTSNKPQDNRY
ncbi:unnamed protein product [Arctogadus glacialis]